MAPIASKKSLGLGTDQTQVDLDIGIRPALHSFDGRLKQVNVQASAQPPIGGDNNVANAFDLPRLHILVLDSGVSVGIMPNHRTDACGVGLPHGYTILSTTHFTGRDHFHRAGNFLRTFNARNLRANFFCACHITRPSSVCVGVAAPPLSYTFWLLNFRSEERRVGKECCSWWSA